MTAKSLLQLRVDVRDRAHVSAKDPRFNDDVVNRSIQQAYGEIASSMPGGWWFQRLELQQTVTTAGSLVPIHTVLSTGYVEAVGYLYASVDGDYWVPIRRRTRTDAVRAGGGSTVPGAIPESWGVQYVGSDGGQPRQLAFVFDPPIAVGTVLRFGATLSPPDLVNDSDLFVGMPAQFTGALIERASARLIRIRREVGNLTTRRRYITAATLCDTAFEGWMVALKRFFGKPYGGPGYGATHWRS